MLIVDVIVVQRKQEMFEKLDVVMKATIETSKNEMLYIELLFTARNAQGISYL